MATRTVSTALNVQTRGLQCLFKHSSTTHHRHRNHTAVSGAKYCMSVDMANMMIHGTSELEVEKKVIYPLVKKTPDCEKNDSNGYQ